MVPQYPENIQEEIDRLPSNREILGHARLWLLAAASVALVAPEVSVAILLGYGLRSGKEYLSVRNKRYQLIKEYTDSAIHYSVKLD